MEVLESIIKYLKWIVPESVRKYYNWEALESIMKYCNWEVLESIYCRTSLDGEKETTISESNTIEGLNDISSTSLDFDEQTDRRPEDNLGEEKHITENM